MNGEKCKRIRSGAAYFAAVGHREAFGMHETQKVANSLQQAKYICNYTFFSHTNWCLTCLFWQRRVLAACLWKIWKDEDGKFIIDLSDCWIRWTEEAPQKRQPAENSFNVPTAQKEKRIHFVRFSFVDADNVSDNNVYRTWNQWASGLGFSSLRWLPRLTLRFDAVLCCHFASTWNEHRRRKAMRISGSVSAFVLCVTAKCGNWMPIRSIKTTIERGGPKENWELNTWLNELQ